MGSRPNPVSQVTGHFGGSQLTLVALPMNGYPI